MSITPLPRSTGGTSCFSLKISSGWTGHHAPHPLKFQWKHCYPALNSGFSIWRQLITYHGSRVCTNFKPQRSYHFTKIKILRTSLTNSCLDWSVVWMSRASVCWNFIQSYGCVGVRAPIGGIWKSTGSNIFSEDLFAQYVREVNQPSTV